MRFFCPDHGIGGDSSRETSSWGWYNGERWPEGSGSRFGFGGLFGPSEGERGEGLQIDAGGTYADMTFRDADGDRFLTQNAIDFLPGHRARADRIEIGGAERRLDDVYAYRDSVLDIKGVPTKVTAFVFLMTDRTYMVRIADDAIPEGVSAEDFGTLRLGRQVTPWHNLLGARIDDFDKPLMTCFTAGTLIDTPDGPRKVEDLRAGDLVITLDDGAQPIRWAGGRAVPGQGAMAPICFAPGALGNEVELRVSPQHRMLLDGWRAELMSGEPQVLAAAKHMVNDTTIRQVPCASVTYVHIMFDRHQIVRSGGVWTESFHPGHQGAAVLNEQWEEIVTIFPELATSLHAYGPTARTCLKSWEVRAILA